MKKTNYKSDTVSILRDLVKLYPKQTLGQHIGIALADYSNFSNITDKELFFIFEKYKCEKELDMLNPHSSELEEIIEDAKHLSIEDIYTDDEDEDSL